MATNSENFNFTVDSTSYTQLTHIGDSTELTRTSNKIKGDGYYGRADGLHTVQYNLIGAVANIIIQATLATDPTDSDWFYAPVTLHEATVNDSTSQTGSFIYNFTGNYIWLRAKVSGWTDGTIRSIIINH